eukprot:1053799-Prymnesium_polylepis.1
MVMRALNGPFDGRRGRAIGKLCGAQCPGSEATPLGSCEKWLSRRMSTNFRLQLEGGVLTSFCMNGSLYEFTLTGFTGKPESKKPTPLAWS